MNFWNLETMRREESAATIYVLKGDQFQVNYNLDGDNGANNSVRVLMVYLMPEFQGNYWVMLKAMRAAYDVLLHNGRTSMNGKCITEEEHDYPFATRVVTLRKCSQKALQAQETDFRRHMPMQAQFTWETMR